MEFVKSALMVTIRTLMGRVLHVNLLVKHVRLVLLSAPPVFPLKFLNFKPVLTTPISVTIHVKASSSQRKTTTEPALVIQIF